MTPIIFLSGGVDDYDNFINGGEITGVCIWDSRKPYLEITEGTLGIISLNFDIYWAKRAYGSGKYEKEIKLNNQLVSITNIIGIDENIPPSYKAAYRCTFRKLATSGIFYDYPPLFLEKSSQGSSLVPIIALGNSLASTSPNALNFDATVLLSRSAMSVSNIDKFGL